MTLSDLNITHRSNTSHPWEPWASSICGWSAGSIPTLLDGERKPRKSRFCASVLSVTRPCLTRTCAALATCFDAWYASAAYSRRFSGPLHEVHRQPGEVLRFMVVPGDGLQTERSPRWSQMSTRAEHARSERDLWPICDSLSAWSVVVSKEPVGLRCEHELPAVPQNRRQIDRFVVCVVTECAVSYTHLTLPTICSV